MSQANPLTKKSVARIMNSRKVVTEQHVGQTVTLRIQGDGNVIDVTDKNGDFVASESTGEVLQKKIFNCKANSQMAISNSRNAALALEAINLDAAGDAQGADKAFSDFTNACQLSFNVLLPNSKASKLADGVEFTAEVIKVTTDNGSLLTIDPTTIAIKQALVLEASTGFDMDAYLPKASAPESAPAEAPVVAAK